MPRDLLVLGLGCLAMAVPLEGRLARGAVGGAPSWLAVLSRARLARAG